MSQQRGIKISGDKLALVWKQSFLSQSAFASVLGLKPRRFADVISAGDHVVFRDTFIRMAAGLKRTPEQLQQEIGTIDEDDEIPFGKEDAPTARPPLKSGLSGIAEAVKVKALHGISATGRRESLDVEAGDVSLPADLRGDITARIDGPSMEPDYPDGGYVTFRKLPGAGQQIPTFGKEYLVWFTNGECYFARVSQELRNHDRLVLKKLNSDKQRFPDVTIERSEIEWMAIAVAVTRKIA